MITFLKYEAGVLVLILFACLLNFVFGASVGRWAFPICSWGGIVFLTIVALDMRHLKSFSLSKASVGVYGFAIVSLIAGLVITLMDVRGNGFNDLDIGGLLVPIMEGLVGTMIAAFCATLLVQMNGDGERGTGMSIDGGMGRDSCLDAGAERELQELNKALREAKDEAQQTVTAIRGVNSELEALKLPISEMVVSLGALQSLIRLVTNFVAGMGVKK